METTVGDIIDYTLIGTSTLWSIENIEHILGIIVLCIQVIWFCAKIIYKLYKRTKTKNPNIDDIKKDAEQFEEVLEEMSDLLNDRKK